MEVRFYIINEDGLAQYDFNRTDVNNLPRVGEKILYYSRIKNDEEVYARVIDVIHVYLDNYVKIIMEPYCESNVKTTSSDSYNKTKKYKVTVTEHYDNAKRVMYMTGTSRKNIFKQLKHMCDQGDSFLNPVVEEDDYI